MAVYTTLASMKKRCDARTIAQWASDADGTVIRTQSDAATALTDADVLANINQAIADASLVVDQMLFGQLDMTSATVQTAVEYHTASIALYYLAARKYLEDDANPWNKRMEEAKDRLRQLAEAKQHVSADPQAGNIDVRSTQTTSTLKLTDTTYQGW